MRKIKYLPLLLLVSLIIKSEVFAETPEQILKRLFPRLSAEEVNRISEKSTIYEVVAGRNIFYIDVASGHVFIGTMLSYNGEDLTSKKYKELAEKRITYLDTAKEYAFQLKKGDNIPIYIVMDPECPHCKKVMDALKSEDVSIYAFFYPLTFNSIKKIGYLIDQVRSGADYYSIDVSKTPVDYELSNASKNILESHKDIVEKLWINGVPTVFVDKERIDGAKVDIVLQKIQEHKTKKIIQK